MKPLFASPLAAVLLAISPAGAEAPSLTVRSFFSALEQHQFARALALTDGDATEVVGGLLSEIDREAAAKHASVELKVRNLQLSERARASAGPVAVDVAYDIDVIGKRWWFRAARRLSGTASFYVDERAPRIVAIVGQLR
jgi:hypothetical protein